MLLERTNTSLPISISDSKFINHNTTNVPLFTISSDEGANCPSKGLGTDWDISDQLTFERLIFEDNFDTQFINIICVKVNVDNITINSNEMSGSTTSSMMLFNRYTRPILSHFNNEGNKGTVIRFNDTYTTRISSHNIMRHEGNYLLYDLIDNSFDGNDTLILKDINFNLCNSLFNTIEDKFSFISILSTIKRMGSINFAIQNVTFESNNGQLISTDIIDNNSSGIDLSICPDINNDFQRPIEFIDCRFISNTEYRFCIDELSLVID